MFHKETVSFLLHFDKNTCVSVNDKFGFTLVPKCLGSDEIYEFCFQDRIGKFEILEIATDEKFSKQLPFLKAVQTFKCRKEKTAVTIWISANVEMKKVHYVQASMPLHISAKDMEMLDIYDYYERILQLPGYDYIKFKYWIKKIASRIIEVEIENHDGIRINGKSGNFIFKTMEDQSVDAQLDVIFPKDPQDSEKSSVPPNRFPPYFYPVINATNFPNAEVACTKLNGHLASIHDGFTNALITGQSGNYFHESTETNFWIGLNSLISPGNWSWTDNSTFDFKDWAPTEPQNLTMNCGTVTMSNGYWASDDCFKQKPFVCEIPYENYPVYANCSAGWIYFEPTHSCYGHDGYNFITQNWTLSEAYCEARGAHSVSLHSYEETKFVSTLRSSNIWTGLISYDNEISWKWTDGSPVDYLPWQSGYPNKNVSSCVNLYAETIIDDDCPDNHYTMCKKTIYL